MASDQSPTIDSGRVRRSARIAAAAGVVAVVAGSLFAPALASAAPAQKGPNDGIALHDGVSTARRDQVVKTLVDKGLAKSAADVLSISSDGVALRGRPTDPWLSGKKPNLPTPTTPTTAKPTTTQKPTTTTTTKPAPPRSTVPTKPTKPEPTTTSSTAPAPTTTSTVDSAAKTTNNGGGPSNNKTTPGKGKTTGSGTLAGSPTSYSPLFGAPGLLSTYTVTAKAGTPSAVVKGLQASAADAAAYTGITFANGKASTGAEPLNGEVRISSVDYTVCGTDAAAACTITYWDGARVLKSEILVRSWVPDSVQRCIIGHELGHGLGLGHVNDTTQLMNPVWSQGSSPCAYQAGDAGGLKYMSSVKFAL